MGPSFQMSFGAVAALVAIARWLTPGGGTAGAGLLARGIARVGRSVVGLLATTVVASLATAPFGAYHFQAVNPFGLIGNALALPLVSLVVMPAALLGVLAHPFGLDRPVWVVMGWAVAQVLDVSAWVAGFSGSILVVPALGGGALAAFALTVLLATVPASSLRRLAALPLAVGVALAATPHRYDAFVDRDGAGAAVRGGDGRLVVVGRPSDFVLAQWLRADGDPRTASDPTLRAGARCDRLGCVVTRAHGGAVAFVHEPAAFEEDCRRAAVVVTRLAAPPSCAAPLVLDRSALRRTGAAALTFGDGVVSVRGARTGEARPWWGASAPPPQAHGFAAPVPPTPRRPEPGVDLPDADEAAGDGMSEGGE